MEIDVTTDGELHLLTGAYALDALDTHERQAFEKHLRICATCRAEVQELQATAGLLGVAAAEQPPTTLKERVMAEVDRTRQDSPVVVDSAADVVVLPQRKAPRVFQIAAAVVTVIAVGLGAWGLQAHQRSSRLDRQITALNAVLGAPDAKLIGGAVKGAGVSGQASVVVSRSLGQAAFVGKGLSQPPSGRAYELWFMTADGTARPAGLISVDSDGTASQLLKGAVDDAALVGITVEPSGGSAKPTTQPVLAVNV